MKVRSYILAAFAVAMGLTACNQQPSFKVEGEVADANGKVLYFEHSGIEGIDAIDSVKLDKSGNFTFKQARNEAPDYYRLRIENKVINFVADSTETIKISAKEKDFATGYSIAESEDNLMIKELVLLQAELQKKVAALSQSGLPLGLAQDSLMNMVNAYKDQVKRNYIYAAPNRSYAYFALFQQLNGMMIFDPFTNKDDVKCFAAVATSLNNKYPHLDRSRNLYNMVVKGLKNTRTAKVKPVEIPIEKVSQTAIIDIPLRDAKGNMKHLTDLKGKVVLLDFTVYGSAESGARNLAMRELYNKYAQKGFEIYQVSLDADEHYWRTAASNLPWMCVRDPRGAYSTFINLYGIKNLPTSYFINRNNEVCMRIGENTDVENELKKLL